MSGSVLVGTAVTSAKATMSNALKYALTETPLIPTITNGDVKCGCVHGDPAVKPVMPKIPKRRKDKPRHRNRATATS